MNFFVPSPPGASEYLAEEINNLGLLVSGKNRGGVFFESDLKGVYKASLYLRTASRILLEIASGSVSDEDSLYELSLSVPWENYFSEDESFLCRVTGVPDNKDPRYAVLRLKDAVADRFSSLRGHRPDVEKRNPDVRVEAHWDGRKASVFINWSGPPLHERGYRLEHTEAVLRETSAAVFLYASGWPEKASESAVFVDPVCGSGTLLIEAAFMSAGMPVGLSRKNWGFQSLKNHNSYLWEKTYNEAALDFGRKLRSIPSITGYDIDPAAVKITKANLRRASLNHIVKVYQHDIISGKPENWPSSGSGLLCADPPYGIRSESNPEPVYRAIGNLFRTLDSGWTMSVIAPDKKTASYTFLKADSYKKFTSGQLNLQMAFYKRLNKEKKKELDPKAPSLKKKLEMKISALNKWAVKRGVTSYRIWDADMPEFNAAVDWYEGKWLHIQEFSAPARVPEEISSNRLDTLIEILKEVTGVSDESIYVKTRRKGIRPYSKLGMNGQKFIIRENGLRFYVNFTDYLDTGIFLDHRPTRALIKNLAKGRRFLNLFCYTGTATAAAAAGGASSTVSVDVSNTYLDWAKDNLILNRLYEKSGRNKKHKFVRSDSFEFLKSVKNKFDLIFIDPPTYSNGSGRKDWSVQKHHAPLLKLAAEHLSETGIIIFSENFRGFVFDSELKNKYGFREITKETLDPDFSIRGKAHRCFIRENLLA